MADEGIDALLIYDNIDFMGGYVRYFSDVGTDPGYSMAIVFPAEGEMTVMTHGPFDPTGNRPPAEGAFRGVKTVSTSWSFSSVSYCQQYDAECIRTALAPFAKATIGLLGLGQMPYELLRRLKADLPHARWLDAADLIDPIKAVKSAEERDFIRGVARQQEAAFEAVLDAIAPGVREHELVSAAWRASEAAGSDGGLIGVGASPRGEEAALNARQHQNRRIAAGDHIIVLIETCGPGGLYTELGRTIVVGGAPDAVHAEHAFAVEAQRFSADLLRPGASPAAIFEAYNAYLRENGRPEERRIHSHGQGYDAVERPLVRSDETLELAEHMNLACHPSYFAGGVTHWICDGYFVGPGAAPEPHHRIEQRLFEST
ncbi:MAG: M24 family metallopeptidase [Solirubrobacterales bacterium]